MKKILAVFLLLASVCSAQIEHSGLTIPGDEAVQVSKKKDVSANEVRDGLVVELLPENYSFNPGLVAECINTGSWGGSGISTVEVGKPELSSNGKYLVFREYSYSPADYLSVYPAEALFEYTVVMAVSELDRHNLANPICFFDQSPTRGTLWLINAEPGTLKMYGDEANKSFGNSIVSTGDSFVAFLHFNGASSDYKIGSEMSTGNIAPVYLNATQPLVIGSRYSFESPVKMRLHYFGIYNRSLTSEEKTTIRSSIIRAQSMPEDTR